MSHSVAVYREGSGGATLTPATPLHAAANASQLHVSTAQLHPQQQLHVSAPPLHVSAPQQLHVSTTPQLHISVPQSHGVAPPAHGAQPNTVIHQITGNKQLIHIVRRFSIFASLL